VLRVYAALTPNGWTVMPGGFCRIASSSDARAVSMGVGTQSADVWVLSDKPVQMVTLLPSDENVRIRRVMGNLPSRAADNLFWFGRYLERAEATLRLLRSFAGKLVDTDTQTTAAGWVVRRMRRLFIAWGAVPEEAPNDNLTLSTLVLHGDSYGSARALARDASRAASFIRERLSADAWRLMGDLEAILAQDEPGAVTEAEAFERADAALRVLSAISGLAQENMIRGAGWYLLDAGRRIERGINTCRFARHFMQKEAAADGLDTLLDLVDSQITYRSRYLMGVAAIPVRDMVVLDPFNPRSVAFQVARVSEHLADLPTLNDDGMLEAPRRRVLKLAAEIATSVAASLENERILVFEQSLLSLASAVDERYFLQGPHLARADKTSGLA
jgi:uncharacterized alpha-E superfamily protein